MVIALACVPASDQLRVRTTNAVNPVSVSSPRAKEAAWKRANTKRRPARGTVSSASGRIGAGIPTTANDCQCTEKTRKREIIQHAVNGGMPCEGRLEEVDDCEYHIGKCEFSLWAHWSECSTDCGQGQREKHRHVVRGTGCEGELCLTEPCTGTSHDCGTDVDCAWGQWNHWSACTCKCGGGQRYRSRVIDTSPKGGGAQCLSKDATEAAACNTQSCPHLCIDGKFSE